VLCICFFLFCVFQSVVVTYFSFYLICVGVHSDASYINTLREVMTGNVGPTLRSMYQLGGSLAKKGALSGGKNTTGSVALASRTRVTKLIPLLCTAHLALLLVSGGGKEDLLAPLQSSPNDTSFFEELFLDVAYQLNALEFPLKVASLSSSLSFFHLCFEF
jgi:hypothetical protein